MGRHQLIASTALGVMLVAAQASLGISSYNTKCEIYPPQPTESGPVLLTVSGVWSNTCTPKLSEVQVVNGAIYLTIYPSPPETICGRAMTDYYISQTVNSLPAGQYTLHAMLQEIAPDDSISYVEICSRMFTVVPGLPVSCGWPDSYTMNPTEPAWNTPIEFALFGQCASSCVPQALNVTVDNSNVTCGRIYLDTIVPASLSCPGPGTPWALSQSIAPLRPGPYYKIYVRRNGLPAEGYLLGSFRVKDGPRINSVYSSKDHGGIGSRDIDVQGVTEPRKGGPTRLWIRFNKDLYAASGPVSADNVTVTGATLSAVTMTSGTCMCVDLASSAPGKIKLAFSGIYDVEGVPIAQTSLTITGLLGDVNGDRVVNTVDLAMIKANIGKPVSQYYRCDLNLSGTIDTVDMALCKKQMSQ